MSTPLEEPLTEDLVAAVKRMAPFCRMWNLQVNHGGKQFILDLRKAQRDVENICQQPSSNIGIQDAIDKGTGGKATSFSPYVVEGYNGALVRIPPSPSLPLSRLPPLPSAPTPIIV